MRLLRYCSLLFLVGICPKIFTEFYVEPYGGILFGAEKYTCIITKNTFGIEGLCACFTRNKLQTIKTRPLVGIKCGGWFHQQNSFGLWLDCQYHRLNYGKCACTCINYIDTTNEQSDPACATTNTYLNECGFAVTLALPLAYRWKHHCTEEYPRGRLQTYLAVGPGLFVTKQCACLTVSPHVASEDNNFTVVVSNTTTINPAQKVLKRSACLMADAGFSCSVSKHCALDLFLRYRFTKYTTCFNRCACLATRKTCHLGSANLGLVINF